MKHEELTAWVLDEISPEEKARIDAALREDAASQKEAQETKDFCDFLSAHLFDPDMALEEEQRLALQKAAKMVEGSVEAKAQPRKEAKWWRAPLNRGLAVAAVIAVVATGAWMVLQEVRDHEAPAAVAWAEADAFPLVADAPEEKGFQSGMELPTINTMNPAAGEGMNLVKENLPFGPVALGKPESLAEESLLPPIGTQWAVTGSSGLTRTDVDYTELDLSGRLQFTGAKSDEIGDARSLSVSNLVAPTAIAGNSGFTQKAESDATALATPPSLPKPQTDSVKLLGDLGADLQVGYDTRYNFRGMWVGDESAATNSPALAGAAGTPSGSGTVAPAAPANEGVSGSGAQPKAYKAFGRSAGDKNELALAPTASPAPAPGMGGYGSSDDRSLRETVGDYIPDADSFAPHPPPALKLSEPESRSIAVDAKPNKESYMHIVENVLQDVARAPLSTFSIDVDTAAYANVRRYLNQNTAPPADAVRIEELINYFPTNDEGPAPDAKEPFAVKVEMAECPWQPQHRLARIAIKGREMGQERKASNLVFLVDVSGSMDERNKLPLVQQSLRMLVDQLGEEDKVSMVVYAGNSGLVLPPTNGLNKPEILAAIDRLKAGGSTHGSAGIRLAYEQAVGGFIKGGVNRVILCTDGDFNVGVSTPEELERLITEKARSGVFLSVLGYGTGNLKDRTMETLADKGNGNYSYIDSVSEARKVLVEQMGGTLVTIAKDVKIQVEFNPRVIRSYRLIGYENRLLAKEDFNDDTKDAGEIGAGHSVTALYELVPANLPPGADPRPVVDALRYQPETAAGSPGAAAAAAATPTDPVNEARAHEALIVKLRYKTPEGSTSELIEVPLRDEVQKIDAASGEFKFTAAVAGFGLLLRQSSYSGELTWEQVRNLAQEGKGSDPHGYRGEFLQLIEKARGVRGR